MRKGQQWLRTAGPAAAVLVAVTVPAALAAPGGEGSGDGRARAAAGEGQPVDLGRRNPGSGASARETSMVANVANNGLVLRPSNTAVGGRAVSATCNNNGAAAENGCAVYVNKGTGVAASFRTQGSVPFALRNTNNGLVEFLNADMDDGMHANQFLAANGTAVNAAAVNDNAITTPKIANEAVTTAKLANGAVGASQLGGVTVQTEESGPIADNSTGSVNVACPAGQRPISGGGSVSDFADQSLLSSRPISTPAGGLPTDGETAVGWRAAAFNAPGAPASITVNAFVLCLG